MITMYVSKILKLAIKDKENNFNISILNQEKILLDEAMWSKVLKPFVVLLDDDMKIISEVYEYLQSKFSKGQELNTIISKGYDLKEFYTFMEINKLKFIDIKARHINDFIVFLVHPSQSEKAVLQIEIKRSGKTVNRIVSTIRNFYQYLNVFYGVNNPFENEAILINKPHHAKEGLLAHTNRGQALKSIYKVKENNKEIKIITYDEYHQIINSLNSNRDKLIFKLMFFTGARIGEILSLKIQDIKTFVASKQVQIIILSKQLENEDIRRRQKTGTRKLFIPNWLYYEIDKYYNGEWDKLWEKLEFEHNYLFLSDGNRSKGNPLSYSTINSKFKEIKDATGIDFSAHDLRHTFATNLARNKVDISTIQKLLGHKNPSTCAVYIQLAKEKDISKELEKIYKAYED